MTKHSTQHTLYSCVFLPPMSTAIRTSAFFFHFLRELSVQLLSCVRLFATPWTVAYQAPPSMGFSRQEYWSGLPFPSPGDLPDPGIEPRFPTLHSCIREGNGNPLQCSCLENPRDGEAWLAADSLPLNHLGNPRGLCNGHEFG